MVTGAKENDVDTINAGAVTELQFLPGFQYLRKNGKVLSNEILFLEIEFQHLFNSFTLLQVSWQIRG